MGMGTSVSHTLVSLEIQYICMGYGHLRSKLKKTNDKKKITIKIDK